LTTRIWVRSERDFIVMEEPIPEHVGRFGPTQDGV
jgi:hypothetical protein